MEEELFYDQLIPDDDLIPAPPEPIVPGLLPELPENPVLPVPEKGKKIIKDIIATYYKKNKKYGDLNVSYDAENIANIAKKVLAANNINVGAEQLQTEIEGNILSGAYKLSTDNDIFVYIFIAGIAIAVYFYFKSKNKK